MSTIEILTRRLREYAQIYAVNQRMIYDYPLLGQLLNQSVDTIESLHEKNQDNDWIPCSERLPEESLNSVIGWDKYRNRCCFVQYLGGRWILGNDIETVKIIAWRPLPEPYKEKQKD